MASVYKVLAQTSPTAATMTTLYTVPAANSTVCSSISICNTSTANTSIRLAVCPGNTAVTVSQYVLYDAVCVPYDTIFLTLGMTLAATDTIRVQSSQANVGFTAFGSENY